MPRGPIAINAIERWAKSGYQMLQRKTEPWLHLSDTGGQKTRYLSSRSRWMPTVHGGAGARRGIWHRHHSKQWELRERKREREIQPTLSEPLTYSTTSTTLTSIWSIALTTKQDPFVGCCWRCQTSAGCHTHGTLSAIFSFIVLLCDDDESVIYRHIKKLIQGFGPRETRDWGMTRWLPTEPVDQ